MLLKQVGSDSATHKIFDVVYALLTYTCGSVKRILTLYKKLEQMTSHSIIIVHLV